MRIFKIAVAVYCRRTYCFNLVGYFFNVKIVVEKSFVYNFIFNVAAVANLLHKLNCKTVEYKSCNFASCDTFVTAARNVLCKTDIGRSYKVTCGVTPLGLCHFFIAERSYHNCNHFSVGNSIVGTESSHIVTDYHTLVGCNVDISVCPVI